MRIEPPFPSAPPREPTQVSDVARAFEALILQQLLKAARQSAATDSPLGAPSEWRDLADRHLAEVMAQGAPFGLARLLEPAINAENGT